MKRILIVYYSPLQDSYTSRISMMLKDKFISMGEEVEVRNLEQLGFNPVPTAQELQRVKEGIYKEDVLREQAYITWADHICLVYPLYQLAMPAMMKGYTDRVFTKNFAFCCHQDGSMNPLMTGKTISFYCPMCEDYEYACNMGNLQAMNHILRSTMEWKGFEVKEIRYFDLHDRDNQLNEL